MDYGEQFWKWFNENEGELFDFEVDKERIFDRLASQLRKVDPNLTFEFGPKQAGKREFIVSAGGVKRAFAAVTSLIAKAPNLNRWRITGFRPRRNPPNIVKFAGKQVDPRDVQFSLLDDGKKAGIYLFIPKFRDTDPDLKQIGYLLLDDALGEYDVESRVALIKMLPPEAPTEGIRYPLVELPTRFDELMRQLGA